MIKTLRGWTYVYSVVQFVPAWKGRRRSQNIKEPKGAVDCIKCSKELHTWACSSVFGREESGSKEFMIEESPLFPLFWEKERKCKRWTFFLWSHQKSISQYFFLYIFPSLPSKQQKKVKAFNFLWFSVLTILFVPTQSVEFKVRGRPLAM